MAKNKQYYQNIKKGLINLKEKAKEKGEKKEQGLIKKAGKYIWNIFVSLDQLGNTILGGSPDETISSRIGRNYKGTIAEKIVNTLFFWQKGKHCELSIEPEDREKDAIIK